MCQQLDLSDVNTALELQDELLWEDAEALTVPADQVVGITSIVRQLIDCVRSILTRAVEYFEG